MVTGTGDVGVDWNRVGLVVTGTGGLGVTGTGEVGGD